MVGSGDITLLSCITVVMSLLEEEGDGHGHCGLLLSSGCERGRGGEGEGGFHCIGIVGRKKGGQGHIIIRGGEQG